MSHAGHSGYRTNRAFAETMTWVIKMTAFKREFNFDDDIRKKISENIKKYRIQNGITQEQLALDIGKSYDFTRRLEFKKGQIGCSIDTLYKISVVLNTRIDKFFE